MQPKIHLRIAVCPVDLNDPMDSFHVDIQCEEPDIQSIDAKHGLEDFIDKFIEPGLAYLLDQFQQPYTDTEDFIKKSLANGGPLPRSIDFYRERLAKLKAKASNAA